MQRMMISFIIIGRNEGWKLTNCINSILNTSKSIPKFEFEVIYIDSASTDDSIERVREFKTPRIYKLTSDYNAAIGRNLGASLARGNIFCFVDGDMELIPGFFKSVFDENGNLIHPFISGQYINHFYNNNRELQKVEGYYNSENIQDDYQAVVGGLFLIEKQLWEKVKGMRNKYRMGEDIDFGLRVAKEGTLLLRKKEAMGNHHTPEYNDVNRTWRLLFNKAELYGKSMLYRDHLFNKYLYSRLIRSDYSLLMLILTAVAGIIFSNGLILVLYLGLILARSVKTARFNLKKLISFPAYFISRDLIVITGIIFFFPRKYFTVTYEKI
jgi:glycosyltransferase involved in cell wall biosynthesis